MARRKRLADQRKLGEFTPAALAYKAGVVLAALERQQQALPPYGTEWGILEEYKRSLSRNLLPTDPNRVTAARGEIATRRAVR